MTRDCSRSHPGQILPVKQANEMAIEVNFVDAIERLFQRDYFADKGSSDKTLAALPFDVAAVGQTPALPSARIMHFW